MFVTLMCMGIVWNINAQNHEMIKKPQPIECKVEIKDMNEVQMVYYEYTGPYMKSFDDFERLMGYLQNQKVQLGPHALGIFYDDPGEVPENELRSEAGHMVLRQIKTEKPYMYKKLEACKAVSVKYYSMEEIMPAYEAIAKFVEENKLTLKGFSIEIYYSNDPEKIDTEILMPLEGN